MTRILIVDDDPFLLKALRPLLEPACGKVETASCAADGLRAVAAEAPDIMVVDIGLPDEDGFSLCRKVRRKWTFPILMLTSRAETYDKVVGLEVGADDYLTKPFEPQELVARVRALLRRRSEYDLPATSQDAVSHGSVSVDLPSRTVTVAGTAVELTDLEFRLTHHFVVNAGKALSRESLFESVWGYDAAFNTNSLEVLVYRLRTKIEPLAGRPVIRTVRGYGYKFSAQE